MQPVHCSGGAVAKGLWPVPDVRHGKIKIRTAVLRTWLVAPDAAACKSARPTGRGYSPRDQRNRRCFKGASPAFALLRRGRQTRHYKKRHYKCKKVDRDRGNLPYSNL